MRQKVISHVPIALFCVCFAMFFFVFEDFAIRLIYVYALFGGVLFLYILTNPQIYFPLIVVAFLLMAFVALFFFMMPYSTREYDMIAVIVTIIFCALLSVFCNPDEKELNAILALIVGVAFAVAVYVIVIAFYPSLYINHISRFIHESSRETTITMLKKGYGVVIGGNAILVNHILVIALLITINKYLLFGYKKGRVKAIAFILLALCAMIFENRKGELLVFVLVTLYAFYTSGRGGVHSRISRGFRFSLISIFVLFVAIVLTIQSGRAERYLVFIEKLFSNEKSDVSSGRIELWKIAIDLFKKHPFFGVGWGSARNYIDAFNSTNHSYIFNVHSLVLQLLCETGLIGCVAFMTPAVFIIFMMKKNVVWLRENSNELLLNVVANVALEYQLFMFFNGMIDSTWHRMSFWPYYLISIILSVAAERLGRQTLDNKMVNCVYPYSAQEDA